MILIVARLLLYSVFAPCLAYGADTLDVNQYLSGNQTLVSRAGTFEMGFFTPGNSSNYYIGIWYNKARVTSETIVWVANRESPISDKYSSRLKISYGNLVLVDKSDNLIWSTNMISTATSLASLVLHDNGNLVLSYGSSSSQPIWQSFDHPTHTFLPGGKLGYNKHKNTSQVLTSWRSNEDPGPGLYSLHIDSIEKQFVLKWNKSVQYWTSGSWDGKKYIFATVAVMRLNYICNFSYVDNDNESYFTYSMYNPEITSRFIIDVYGQIMQLSWMDASQQWNLFWSQPRQICEIYASCGPFGVCSENTLPFCNCLTAFEPRSLNDWGLNVYSGGCMRKTKLSCSAKSGFILSYVPSTFLSSSEIKTLLPNDESACRNFCLVDCSCYAYTFVSEQCHLWNDESLSNVSVSLMLSDSNSQTFAINIKVCSENTLPIYRKKNGFPVGTVAGSVVGLFLFLGLILLIIYRKKRVLVGKTKMEGSLVAFVYKDLQAATKNFSDKLGGGGFGSVYKAVLRDSSIVAVKKLEGISQGEKQFRSEVSTIGIIQHIHLVRLRGFCAEGDSRLLVYDYLPNGSLHSHLFHEKQDNVLNWKTRYHIALGIARGLVYLHEKCRDCIIHCDIKPENILLDADFHPKIADFGLAKLVSRDFSRVLTTIRGTRGYLAPEWLSGVAITAKADVFSYGMMLFELVHGKRNTERYEDSNFSFFPSLAASVLMVGGDILSLIDSRLNREASVDEVTKIFKVAYWCIQDQEDNRPSMSLVEQILEGVSNVNMPPIPKYVNFFVDKTEHDLFFTKISSNENSQSNFPSGDSLSDSASSS